MPRGIPNRQTWTPEMDAMLGKESDITVATRLGLSHMAVCNRRNQLRIPSLNPRSERAEWTPEMDAHLGTATDLEIAQILGVSENQVNMRRRKLNIMRITPETMKEPTGAKVLLDIALVDKIKRLELILVHRFRRMGIPTRQLEAWQVIEVAVDYMTAQSSAGKLK